MTSMARSKRDFVLSTRAPYVPIVMLIGAVAVIAVVIRLLNASDPAAPSPPLSGVPVGNSQPPVVITQPATETARGSLSLLMPVNVGGEPLPMGPAAFPAGSSVALSVLLPTDQPTSIEIALASLQRDGTLQEAAPVSVDVVPDESGAATVSTGVDQLTAELGAGVYRVELRWDGDRIGGADVALGMAQPSNVAIFDEPRGVSFAEGRHVGVRVDASGAVSEEKPVGLPKSSSAPASAYGLLNGRPHVYITAGVWDGYWLQLGDGVALN